MMTLNHDISADGQGPDIRTLGVPFHEDHFWGHVRMHPTNVIEQLIFTLFHAHI